MHQQEIRQTTGPARLTVAALLLFQHIHSCNSHGAMQWPPSWFDPGGSIGMSAHGFMAGAFWFTNHTNIVGRPTINSGVMLTYPGFEERIVFAKNPWRAPGTAAVMSPCGWHGGNPDGCPIGDPNSPPECPGGGFPFGKDSRQTAFPDVVTTRWVGGSVVPVAWGIKSNHGGGYLYRLCRIPPEGPAGLTEECFRRTTLRFVGDDQYVQYGNDSTQRVYFKANRTTTGTSPKGSQWTKNPIPACAGFFGGYDRPHAKCAHNHTQFPPPAQGLNGSQLFGYGLSYRTGREAEFGWSIVDQVQVPLLQPGLYVLSFRWDVEQTPQVWNTCANIEIVAP